MLGLLWRTMKVFNKIGGYFYHIETTKKGLWVAYDMNKQCIPQIFGISKIENLYKTNKKAIMIVVWRFKIIITRVKK